MNPPHAPTIPLVLGTRNRKKGAEMVQLLRPAWEPESRLDRLTISTLDDHKNVEKQRILAALEACGWNRVRAAQTLGMPRRTFYRRLADYSIL